MLPWLLHPSRRAETAGLPEEEIARRKARRRLSRTIAIAIVSIVSVLLVVAGGFYLYNEYRSHQANVSQLDDALDLMASTDETLPRS